MIYWYLHSDRLWNSLYTKFRTQKTYRESIVRNSSLNPLQASLWWIVLLCSAITLLSIALVLCQQTSTDTRSLTIIFSSSKSFHLSMVTLRTNERWTPRLRCTPEHSKQIQIPYVTETHCGFNVPHSKHFCKENYEQFWISCSYS